MTTAADVVLTAFREVEAAFEDSAADAVVVCTLCETLNGHKPECSLAVLKRVVAELASARASDAQGVQAIQRLTADNERLTRERDEARAEKADAEACAEELRQRSISAHRQLSESRAHADSLAARVKGLEEAAQRIVRESSDGEAMAIAAEALGVPFDRTDDTGAAALSPSPTTTPPVLPADGIMPTSDGQYGVCLNAADDFYGWLFWRHPDGKWVSKRKATLNEIGRARMAVPAPAGAPAIPAEPTPPASSPTTRAEARPAGMLPVAELKHGATWTCTAGDCDERAIFGCPTCCEACCAGHARIAAVAHDQACVGRAAPAPSTPIDGTGDYPTMRGESLLPEPAAPSSIEAARPLIRREPDTYNAAAEPTPKEGAEK